MIYLVMNIGCIECGVSSAVVGIFNNEAKAQEIADKCQEVHGWREGGQNNFEVFELPMINEVAEEYRDAVFTIDGETKTLIGEAK